MRVISFCADGLREAAKRGCYDWLARQDADFICIQDLRCSEYDLQEDLYFPRDYNAYFFDDVGGRENGVAIYCRQLPKAIMTGLGFADFDMQGRYIQADFPDLSVGCLLAPGLDAAKASSREHRDAFFALLGPHLQKIRNKRREYIICGNWTIDPDVGDSAWMEELLSNGYVDAYREVSADEDGFTYLPEQDDEARRIDLQVISEDLSDRIEHAAVYTGQRFSAHAPLIVDYDIDL
jgi:exodeoxyribonuclease-3